MQRQRNSESDL